MSPAMRRASWTMIPLGYAGVPVGLVVWLVDGDAVLGIAAIVIGSAAATLAVTRLRGLGHLRRHS